MQNNKKTKQNKNKTKQNKKTKKKKKKKKKNRQKRDFISLKSTAKTPERQTKSKI